MSTKELTKDMVNKFSIPIAQKNIFLQEYFKIIKYLYQLKNTLNILVTLPEQVRGNLV